MTTHLHYVATTPWCGIDHGDAQLRTAREVENSDCVDCLDAVIELAAVAAAQRRLVLVQRSRPESESQPAPLGPHPLELTECPKCKAPDPELGYGLLGGGVGTYALCDKCGHLAKREDRA